MKNAMIIGIVVIVVAIGALVFFMMQDDEETTSIGANTNTTANTNTGEATAKDTIVDVAAANGSFSTLVTAIQAAGLADTLSGPGPFTVFAPTDDAFDALPDGTLDTLLADTDLLADVLTYHVASGSVMAADVVELSTVPTLLGDNVDVDVSGSTVYLGDAMVTQTDIEASNGVIHVIDTVLVPDSVSESLAMMDLPNIVETARAAGSFSTLVTALEAAGLDETLSGDGPFTVFAPTDAAFDALPAGTLDSLLADTDQLTDVLTYHVVSGKVMAADVVTMTSAATVQGSDLTIDTSEGVRVNDAAVTQTDIEASNGVIHVIDTVLIPS